MKKISDCALCRAVCDKCRGLFDYQLRHKYDMSVWIYPNEQSDTAECAHRWTGDCRHHLWKIAVFLGGIALFCGLIRGLLSLMRKV